MNDDPFHASSVTPASLLAGVRNGEERAWNRLVRLYSPWVYAYCRQCGIPSFDAADILQETFRAVFRGFGGFQKLRAEDRFRAWLRTVTQNKIRDYFRARNRHGIAFGGSTAQDRWENVSDSLSLLMDSQASEATPNLALHAALSKVQSEFESHNWQAFWLTVVEQRPVQEVTASLNMTPNAIRQARYRILRRLRDELSAD